ncbi:hypothetical protein [Nonomuraea sp. NPDC049725]|uniref:beta family protein n=1 Tax=Nonomuraea sp. NPDC049725 TaxID=3154508 RepID=UPI0034217B46
MTAYTVIVNSRRPSLQALGHASKEVKDSVRPLIEVVARPGDGSPKVAVDRVTGQLRQNRLDSGVDLALDTRPLVGRFGKPGAREALKFLAVELDFYSFRPVAHLGDTLDDLNEVRDAIQKQQSGVCLRVDGEFLPSLRGPEMLLEQLRSIGEPAWRTDLVIDCGYITSPATAFTRVADCLGPLVDEAGRWQSVTVVAGSFPPPETFVTPATAQVTCIPRREADLWRRIAGSWDEVGYGDYGVDHPGLLLDEPGWPAPNLRYTVGRRWFLYYWPVGEDRKHTPFYDLCQELVESPDWPHEGADFSWGDERIARAARRDGGAGGAGEWKAYSLSHHLATVVGMLRREGRP